MLLLAIHINTIYTLSISLYLAILAKYIVFAGILILIIILARTLCNSTPPRLLTQSFSNFYMWSGLHRASAVRFLEIVGVTT